MDKPRTTGIQMRMSRNGTGFIVNDQGRVVKLSLKANHLRGKM